MILAHRIQLDPTAKQRIYFAKAAGTARLVWNWSLAEWNEQCGAENVETYQYGFAGRACSKCLPPAKRRDEFPGWTN